MAAAGCCRHLEEEDEQFFDSRDDFSSSSSDSCPSSPALRVADDPLFHVWVHNPGTVRERRDKFLKWMGLDPTLSSSLPDSDKEITAGIDRILLDCGAVLGGSDSENVLSMSSWYSESSGISFVAEDTVSEENYGYKIKSLDDGREFVVDEFGEDGVLRSLREVGSDRMMTLDEFERSFSPASFVRQLMRREDSSSSNSEKSRTSTRRRRRNFGWLKRLGAVACVVDIEGEESNLDVCDSDESKSDRIQRIKVRPHRKRSKEFSAVYMGQDIKGHDGAILTMRFSPDGQYLASGGEDGVVRIWHVTENEWKDGVGIPKDDPSCIYFTVNDTSELVPLNADKEKKGKSSSMRRTSDSACVVFPPCVFRLCNKPLHEFHGHDGDVLDLSWSRNKYLLSSSTDKTARLWQVGSSSCLKVFSHNNYVTSVQFNPANEKYFISGSIDGKIRIWEIPGCRVVDWTYVKDIVTAVCYQPGGKIVVVGTMTGSCRFYDASDNFLQLDAQVSFQGKKKSLDKRITGFQFCPSDHRKLIVTTADSQVRILDGVDIISKYKGLRNAGSQISASFTSDGRHIISASEDSNVYIWTCSSQNAPTAHQAKSTWACERFFSRNVSVAIPWHGLEPITQVSVSSDVLTETFGAETRTGERDLSSSNTFYLSPSGSFTLSQEFFPEFLPKGSATWPEEQLPSGFETIPPLCKSQYKFLKSSCQNSSHAWGQVIVTAGWDGRICAFQNYGLPVHH